MKNTPFAAQAAAQPPIEPPASPTDTSSDARTTSFQPVKGGNDLQSGEVLLVEAYAAIWIIVFVMVLVSWRRQRRIDRRVDTLEAALEKARVASGVDGGR